MHYTKKKTLLLIGLAVFGAVAAQNKPTTANKVAVPTTTVKPVPTSYSRPGQLYPQLGAAATL